MAQQALVVPALPMASPFGPFTLRSWRLMNFCSRDVKVGWKFLSICCFFMGERCLVFAR